MLHEEGRPELSNSQSKFVRSRDLTAGTLVNWRLALLCVISRVLARKSDDAGKLPSGGGRVQGFLAH